MYVHERRRAEYQAFWRQSAYLGRGVFGLFFERYFCFISSGTFSFTFSTLGIATPST